MNKLITILILFFAVSCSSDLDFNQATDIKLKPAYALNFAAFDVLPNQFIVGGIEQSVVTDVLNYDVLKDPFFNNNLKKANFSFEVDNTINRAYTVNVNYLDTNDSILFTVSFNVPAYTGVENSVTKNEVFENAKLNLLRQTKRLEFVVTMLPGPPLNENSLGSLKLRSSATIYIILE